MIAPIFSVCAASQAVKDLLGTNPVRLYPFGMQDDNIVYPYAVWQNIDGSPENYLNQRPDADRYSLQVDVYGDTDIDVIAVSRALRDAIEGNAHITRWGEQTRDQETGKYRYSFDIDWIVQR
ncbi:tail completion protein gp17 [Klebsiella aerogenes]